MCLCFQAMAKANNILTSQITIFKLYNIDKLVVEVDNLIDLREVSLI